MRWALAGLLSILIAILGVWFAYTEARTILQALPKRLRAFRQRRDFRRLTPEWQAIVGALDPGAVPRDFRLSPAVTVMVIPGGHPRLHR